jgi:phage terminase small subunit
MQPVALVASVVDWGCETGMSKTASSQLDRAAAEFIGRDPPYPRGVRRSVRMASRTGLPSNFCAGKLKFLAKLNSVVKGFVMRRGPKPELPSVKANGGTFRPHRDRFKVEVSTSNALPIKPDWLSPAGQTIWDENVTRAAAVGVTEHDTVIFTIFCNLTGEVVQAVQAGKAVSMRLLGPANPSNSPSLRTSVWAAIDSKRMLIRVELGKGRKAAHAVFPRSVHPAVANRRYRLSEQCVRAS